MAHVDCSPKLCRGCPLFQVWQRGPGVKHIGECFFGRQESMDNPPDEEHRPACEMEMTEMLRHEDHPGAVTSNLGDALRKAST